METRTATEQGESPEQMSGDAPTLPEASSLEEAANPPESPTGEATSEATADQATLSPAPTGGQAVLRFENNQDFLRFLFARIREKKKWWLLPLLLLLYLLSMFFNIPGKESVLPALYFIF